MLFLMNHRSLVCRHSPTSPPYLSSYPSRLYLFAHSSSPTSPPFHSCPPTVFLMVFFFCSLLHLPPTSLSHLSTLFSLSNNNLSSLSLSCSFFLSTHLFFLQEATFIFGLHCSVCICHVLHLPLTDPLETVVVLCV